MRSEGVVALVGAVLLMGQSARGANQPNIAPRAEQILREACQYLATTPFFSLNAEVWREHVDQAGVKVQFAREIDMEVKRPNRLHANIHSSHTQREFWYDGRELTILDGKRNLYSTAPMPKELDEALDTAHDQFGVDLPLIDLAVSDPYKNAMAKVQSGVYFGLSPAMGFSCHHLAFTQANIDWQVWIQDGPQPLIRKFVITHKNEPGSPEFTGLIKQWNLSERIADGDFVFTPPPDARKIEMRKSGQTQPLAPTGRANEHTSAPAPNSTPLKSPKDQ